jgi:hypothetical protein
VGLERGPLSLVSTTEELFERNSSGSGLENSWIRLADHATPQKLALTPPTTGCRSVDIVRSRTKATELIIWPKITIRFTGFVDVPDDGQRPDTQLF